MNTIVTSRQQLLEAAEAIARQEGLAQVSIRRVAGACNVSVGSLYNYFPTKADLIVAIIEDFWRGAFHGLCWDSLERQGFVPFFGALYRRFSDYLSTFESDWLAQLYSLSQEARRKGKATEQQYFHHIRQGLLEVLRADSHLSPDLWRADFTQEDFVAFVFSNMLSMLREGRRDCDFFLLVLEKLLTN